MPDFLHFLEISQPVGAAAAEQVSLLLMMAMFGGEFMGPIAGAPIKGFSGMARALKSDWG